MKKRAVFELSPYSESLFSAICEIDKSEGSPFSVITPHYAGSNGESLRVVLPETGDDERAQRAARALRRILGAGLQVRIHHEDFDELSSWSEFQLWTIGNWVSGGLGSQSADDHFMKKIHEEYLEAQDDVHDGSPHAADEIVDWLFCISAQASNHFINLSDYIRDEVDEIRGHISRHPEVVFDELDTLFNSAGAAIKSYIARDSEPSYNDGVEVTEARYIRHILSTAHAHFWNAKYLLIDDEIDDDEEEQEMLEAASRSFARAVVLALLAVKMTIHDTETIVSVMSAHTAKLYGRIKNGQAVTRA